MSYDKPIGIVCFDHISVHMSMSNFLVIKRIECFYKTKLSKKIWVVYIDNWDYEIISKYKYFDNDTVPIFIRKIFATKIFREGITIPKIENNNFLKCYFDRDRYNRDFALVQELHNPNNINNISSIYDLYILVSDLLNKPRLKLYIYVYMIALQWRKFTKNAEKRRTQLRNQIINEELIAVTWHPNRMINWCWDQDDINEFNLLLIK